MVSKGTAPVIREPDPLTGHRRPTSASSSPSAKSDRDSHHVKKKVRMLELNLPENMEGVTVEDVTQENSTNQENREKMPIKVVGEIPNAWTQRSNKLFEDRNYTEDWYIADSDSECRCNYSRGG
ncbi:hypothetical protein LINGRAHAP2_LOCUS23066 [Linum grandiflorum]